jgi:hypothetical protein
MVDFACFEPIAADDQSRGAFSSRHECGASVEVFVARRGKKRHPCILVNIEMCMSMIQVLKNRCKLQLQSNCEIRIEEGCN